MQPAFTQILFFSERKILTQDAPGKEAAFDRSKALAMLMKLRNGSLENSSKDTHEVDSLEVVGKASQTPQTKYHTSNSVQAGIIKNNVSQ